MNRHLLLGLVFAAVCGVIGVAFQDTHYRLDVAQNPADQRVLAHRDSPYTSMTWVASPSNNYLQLRFFDRVEGGICLEPTWADLAADPRLAHLKPAEAPTLPDGIDPGAVNSSAYITFFPAGLLLNRTVPAAPKVLIVGLGSGIGIAQLAYHFPQVAIEVVDIDAKVVAMVRGHFPMLAWLETQRTSAGEPRLKFVVKDARAHMQASKGRGFNMVILDAYTAGSTIPPHLMTEEFFATCAATLADGGVVLANVIGCYGQVDADGVINGFAHRVLGGALRAFRNAGLTEAWCIPVLMPWDTPASFDRSQSRNNILVAAKHPLSPRSFPDGWDRLRTWVPFSELPIDRWVSEQYYLIGKESSSTLAPAAWIDPVVPDLRRTMVPRPYAAEAPQHTRQVFSEDKRLITAAAAAVLSHAGNTQLYGWKDDAVQIVLRRIDWVQFPRENWRTAIAFARDASLHDPEELVGPVDGPERESAPRSWGMPDAPRFTDGTPNADIMNR